MTENLIRTCMSVFFVSAFFAINIAVVYLATASILEVQRKMMHCSRKVCLSYKPCNLLPMLFHSLLKDFILWRDHAGEWVDESVCVGPGEFEKNIGCGLICFTDFEKIHRMNECTCSHSHVWTHTV